MLPDQLDFALTALRKHGLTPWLDTGTALGLARTGGILWGPDEDDIDIGIWADEAEVLELAKADFEAAGYRCEVWSWRGLPFKWKFLPADPVADYSIDIKLYRRAGDHCWTPLVYHRHPPSRPLWALWNGLRKRLLRREDERRLGVWPLAACLGVYSFWIPARYFDELEPWNDTKALVPSDLDGFLGLHYGDWSRPVKPWVAALHDGSVRRQNPMRLTGTRAFGEVRP